MEREISNTFYSALGQTDLEYGIELYNKEIAENDPKNFAAWNNRGVNKVYLGAKESNLEMVEDGINDIINAIALAKAEEKDYPLAEGNINWANKVKSEM